MATQNKETYLESTSGEYKQEHYPEGSVFKARKKAMEGVNVGLGLFFMGTFLAGSIADLVWSINRTLEIIRDKEESMLGVGIGISVFFLLLVTVFGVAILLITKDIRKTMDDWVRVAARAGGLEEQGIREFDKRAMGSDSLILGHLEKLESFTTGQKGGILARDHICLYGGNMPCVLKLNRLTQTYIKDNTYCVKVGRTRRQAHYLTIHLMTEDKKIAWAGASREVARALQEELESQCPRIGTARGSVLPG